MKLPMLLFGICSQSKCHTYIFYLLYDAEQYNSRNFCFFFLLLDSIFPTVQRIFILWHKNIYLEKSWEWARKWDKNGMKKKLEQTRKFILYTALRDAWKRHCCISFQLNSPLFYRFSFPSLRFPPLFSLSLTRSLLSTYYNNNIKTKRHTKKPFSSYMRNILNYCTIKAS